MEVPFLEYPIWWSWGSSKPTLLGRPQVDVPRTFLRGTSEDFLRTLWGRLSNVPKFHFSFLFKTSIGLIYLNSLQYYLFIFGMLDAHRSLLFIHPIKLKKLNIACGPWASRVLWYNFSRTPAASVRLFIKTSL